MDSADMKEIKDCCERLRVLSREMVQAKKLLNRIVNEKAKEITDDHVEKARAAGDLVEDDEVPTEGVTPLLTAVRSGLMEQAHMAMFGTFENVMAMYGNDTAE